MCGIFAYFSVKELSPSDINRIIKMSEKIKHRGPDAVKAVSIFNNRLVLVFYRLSIVDLSPNATQPFTTDGYTSICNGEIYNYISLKNNYKLKTSTNCDTEVLPGLISKLGIYKVCESIDGVFTFVIANNNSREVYIARDPFGVRSLYFSEDSIGNFIISSEMKAIPSSFYVQPFPPGNYAILKLEETWKFGDKIPYYSYNYPINRSLNSDTIPSKIKKLLDEAVNKRLMSNRQIGCLLSGGLDSSIIASLLAKKYKSRNEKLRTFSIGLKGSVDLKFAQLMADYLETEHTTVEVTEEEMINTISEDIYHMESYDTTTIRASTPMYLLCKYIKQNTDITVLFSGEGSDEASGSYMYFHNAPSPNEFQNECVRLLKDLHRFDVLRCEKSATAHSLEIRVPFLDLEFMKYYMSIDPELKMAGEKIEKKLLREAFKDLLPNEIYERQKEAFSDGVSSLKKSWAEVIQENVESIYSDEDFKEYEKSSNPPLFKESLHYRKIFNKYYPKRDSVIPYYWLPKWSGKQSDPSARILNVYKKN